VRRELRRRQSEPDIAAECDKSWLRLRDARTGAIKEFLLGIKVIKVGSIISRNPAHMSSSMRGNSTSETTFSGCGTSRCSE
jgi:hypothetical protein